MSDLLGAIRQRVSMADVLERIGIDTFSVPGYAHCPLQGEPRGHSMHITHDRWHCAFCKQNGDVIDLYAAAVGVSYLQACKALEKLAFGG